MEEAAAVNSRAALRLTECLGDSGPVSVSSARSAHHSQIQMSCILDHDDGKMTGGCDCPECNQPLKRLGMLIGPALGPDNHIPGITVNRSCFRDKGHDAL